MESLPFHPIVVHFPLVLATLFPLVVGALLTGILRGRFPRGAWVAAAIHAGLLFAMTGAAMKTGEMDEEKVERIVPEHLIHDHEENAEILLALAGLAVIASAGVLVRSATEGLAHGMMWATLVLSIAGAVVAVLVGHTGGGLVYIHGAAEAHRPQAVQGDTSLFETPSDDGDERDVE